MNLKQIVSVVLAGVISIGSPLTASADTPNSEAFHRIRPPRRGRQTDNLLAITSPKFGQSVTGSSVNVSLTLSRSIDEQSLRIRLNGKDITDRFSRGTCRPSGCNEDANLTTVDGLRAGENALRASARGFDRHIEFKRVRFDYNQGLLGDGTQTPYLPSAVGFSLSPAGAQPWITLTTGTPASPQDPIDRTQNSVPYPDTTFPLSTDTSCSQTYQVLELDRATPADTSKEKYSCYGDSTDLKNHLMGLTAGSEIVIVGTTAGNNATAGLDTSSIGGTNYGSAPPQSYAIIGVPNAPAGTAYESYSSAGDPVQYPAFATGMLAKDGNGWFNFHAGDNRVFKVSPNDATAGTSLIQIDSQTYTAPSGSSNGFWLLQLDAVQLQPIDSSFFSTGSDDSATAAQAVSDLGWALQNVNPRALAVLTTVGKPFASGSVVSGQLSYEILVHGGIGYTMPTLTSASSTYTLIAPGNATNSITMSPFTHGVVQSSTAYGQTGFVRGVLARNNQSLYAPSVASQEDGKENGPGATTVSIDYTFHQIIGESPVDWPDLDTPGHIAAYHYASSVFIANHFGYNVNNSVHSQDLRYFYAGNPEYGQYNTDFLPGNARYPTYPSNPNGFTEQDLIEVNGELYKELTALNDAYNYLGLPGLGQLFQSGNTSVADQVIAATYEVLEDQVMPVFIGAPVSASASDWMNLLAGVASIGAAFVGPLEIPVTASVIGVMSGLLWSGSALAPFASNNDVAPPSYESGFDTTLGTLLENQTVYADNIINSYATALDSIYSDSAKLQAVQNKTASTWQIPDQVSLVKAGEQMKNGVLRSTYLQLVPQLYQLDTYLAQPVSDISKIGTQRVVTNPVSDYVEYHYSCLATYPSSMLSEGYKIYPGSVPSDIFALGGTINYQNSGNVSESLPSQTLLDTLFGVGNLNIPPDLLFGSHYLTQRSGPNQGGGLCYKIGCTALNNSTTCVGP
ncbi:MAG TPA: hypothetical protein VHZ55_22315 [Bryobacteraceae bacterium]|nr:hypothetical protein [Bryobacteraceae bacterium]